MKTTKEYYITKVKANDTPYYIVNEYGVAYPHLITENLNDARALVDKLENEQLMENLKNLKLKELEELYWSRVKDGYRLNPELEFHGFKGRITKERWIWSIKNQIKK